jgi:hypothetical protein
VLLGKAAGSLSFPVQTWDIKAPRHAPLWLPHEEPIFFGCLIVKKLNSQALPLPCIHAPARSKFGQLPVGVLKFKN